jgi:hypothetical protein
MIINLIKNILFVAVNGFNSPQYPKTDNKKIFFAVVKCLYKTPALMHFLLPSKFSFNSV